MSKKIKSSNIDWILELVEKGVIEFVGEPVQTKNGFEYTFKFINQTKEDEDKHT